VTQAEQFNKGREGLINAVLNNPKNPVPVDQRDAVAKQLEDGLLLPVEDCGADPAQ
jgi:hypothetical protein